MADTDWLELCGQQGWQALMKDDRIRYVAAEKQALINHRVRAGVLTNANLSADQMTDRIIRAVAQFAEKHEAFTEPGLRWLIFNASERHSSRGVVPANGLKAALVRNGRRILIDETEFFEWVDRQGRAHRST